MAQAGLASSLQPALDHLLRAGARWSPGLGRVHQLRDEIFLLLNSTIQLHYLKVYHASFTENFYGLERATDQGKPLSLKPSFLLLVIAPYIRRKLEQIFLRCREDEADGIQCRTELRTKTRDIYVKLFPVAFFCLRAASLGFLLSFTLKGSKNHSLSSYLAGIYLIYIDPEKLQEREAKNEEFLNEKGGWRNFMAKSVSSMAKLITFSLEVGSFFLQFLEWWYNQDRESKESMADSIPRPPEPIKGLPRKGASCPICLRQRKGETVLSSSGLVFCYVCIVKYLRRHGKCPVTSLPSKENQLIRLFAIG